MPNGPVACLVPNATAPNPVEPVEPVEPVSRASRRSASLSPARAADARSSVTWPFRRERTSENAHGFRGVRHLAFRSRRSFWRSTPSRDTASTRRERRRARAGLLADAAGSYPVVERFGYVWIWYGDPEDASDTLVPDVPFLPREGGLPVRMQGSMRLDCCTPLFLENLLDPTHGDYLHANLLGDERSDQDRVEVRFTSETVTMIRRCTHKSIAPIMRWFGGLRATYQDVHVAIHVHVRSSVAIAYGRYTPGIDLPIFHPCVPESRDRCRLSFAPNMTRAPWLLRALMPLTPYIVLPQDNRMVGPQSTRYRDAGERRGLYSRFDRAGLRYRLLLQQLANRQRDGDFSYAADALPGQDARGILGMPD